MQTFATNQVDSLIEKKVLTIADVAPSSIADLRHYYVARRNSQRQTEYMSVAEIDDKSFALFIKRFLRVKYHAQWTAMDRFEVICDLYRAEAVHAAYAQIWHIDDDAQ